MFVRRFWGLGFAQEAVLCILAQARALGWHRFVRAFMPTTSVRRAC
jgi:RimJ/RimL family protein N-acetyltransferase